MKQILVLSSVLSLIACGHATADSITLQNGYTATGTILQTNYSDNAILLLRDYATADYYIPIIKTVKIENPEDVAVLPNTNRCPDWKQIVLNLSKQPWAQNLKQIPATVIDKGILRNVPYVSFRCAQDYEVNIYGDLDHPAGFEVGIYRKLLNDDTAKVNCLRFVEALLPDVVDKETLGKLKRERDRVIGNGFTFEITPPTADDAYLGWWVSIYDEKRLNLARASESELTQISVAKSPSTAKSAGTQENPDWTAQEMKLARPAQSYQPRFVPAASGYTPPRTATPTAAYNSGGSSPSPTYSGGGRVYVWACFEKTDNEVESLG